MDSSLKSDSDMDAKERRDPRVRSACVRARAGLRYWICIWYLGFAIISAGACMEPEIMGTIKHHKVTGAAANPNVLVDGPAWDAGHDFMLTSSDVGLGNVPNIDTTNASNLSSGTLPTARLPPPTSSTLGGIKSIVAAAHNWISSIGTDGTPIQTQPAATDISGLSAFIASGGAPFVILASGQSNFHRAKTFTWTPPSNVQAWNVTVGTDGSVGTAFAALDGTKANYPQMFAAEVAKANPGRTVYLVNIAIDGIAIAQWTSDATNPKMFVNITNNIVPALAAIGVSKIDLFIWWQGEADANSWNPSYIANFATMMGRFWGTTWFPQEAPVVINGIASSATVSSLGSPPAQFYDKMNDLLIGVVGADPDKRRFVYTGELSGATYWDGSDVGHMTAQGYQSAAIMGAGAFLRGPGRNTSQRMFSDPATGNVNVGIAAVPDTALMVNNNSNVIPTAPFSSTIIHALGVDGAAGAAIEVDGTGGGSLFIGRASRGTLASPSALQSGDVIAGYSAFGYDGSAFTSVSAAGIFSYASENWTSAHHGTYCSIYNSIPLTTTLAESLRVAPGVMTLFGTTSGSFTIGANATGSPFYTGTITNDSAPAGAIGERVDASVLIGSAVALTNATAKTVTSISLTAGDWEVSGVVALLAAASTNVTSVFGSINTTTNAVDVTTPGRFSNSVFGASGIVPGSAAAFTQVLPPTQVKLSVTTTYFLTAQANFTVAGLSAYGEIHAVRVR